MFKYSTIRLTMTCTIILIITVLTNLARNLFRTLKTMFRTFWKIMIIYFLTMGFGRHDEKRHSEKRHNEMNKERKLFIYITELGSRFDEYRIWWNCINNPWKLKYHLLTSRISWLFSFGRALPSLFRGIIYIAYIFSHLGRDLWFITF